MNKENEMSDEEWSSLYDDPVEGWDAYYQAEAAQELEALQKELEDMQGRPELPEDEHYATTPEVVEWKILKIKTLQSLHKSLVGYGYNPDMLFVALTHTSESYFRTVIAPMHEMVEAGNHESAWRLFVQPRHIHR